VIAENELLSAANSIEAAAKKLAQLQPRLRPRVLVLAFYFDKKQQKLSCVKLAVCPDHPRRRSPLKFCVRGRVRDWFCC